MQQHSIGRQPNYSMSDCNHKQIVPTQHAYSLDHKTPTPNPARPDLDQGQPFQRGIFEPSLVAHAFIPAPAPNRRLAIPCESAAVACSRLRPLPSHHTIPRCAFRIYHFGCRGSGFGVRVKQAKHSRAKTPREILHTSQTDTIPRPTPLSQNWKPTSSWYTTTYCYCCRHPSHPPLHHLP
jgi:hypothetical protein